MTNKPSWLSAHLDGFWSRCRSATRPCTPGASWRNNCVSPGWSAGHGSMPAADLRRHNGVAGRDRSLSHATSRKIADHHRATRKWSVFRNGRWRCSSKRRVSLVRDNAVAFARSVSKRCGASASRGGLERERWAPSMTLRSGRRCRSHGRLGPACHAHGTRAQRRALSASPKQRECTVVVFFCSDTDAIRWPLAVGGRAPARRAS
jgi:hypothetical protein